MLFNAVNLFISHLNKKKIKLVFKSVFEYFLLGTRVLFAYLILIFNSVYLFFAFFLIDLLSTLYKKLEDDKDKDLSMDGFDKLKRSTKEIRLNYEKLAKDQKIYFQNQERTGSSLKLLNKIVSDSLIREKDLLSFAGTAGYYQLFVYSASLSKLFKYLKKETVILREYPGFLESIGFVRLGKNSTLFIINKNRLKDEKLKSIKEFKKFLSFHFSKIRAHEWRNFLGKLRIENRREYRRILQKNYKVWGYLKYNFLLTETNMNPTNIGFVDGDRMGLGAATRRDEIYSQILEKANMGKFRLSNELKIKIKRIIEKQDISLLLEGFLKKDKDQIALNQDVIKENVDVENIIDFCKINPEDLGLELQNIGFTQRKSNALAKQIVSSAIQYREALDELGVNI